MPRKAHNLRPMDALPLTRARRTVDLSPGVRLCAPALYFGINTLISRAYSPGFRRARRLNKLRSLSDAWDNDNRPLRETHHRATGGGGLGSEAGERSQRQPGEISDGKGR